MYFSRGLASHVEIDFSRPLADPAKVDLSIPRGMLKTTLAEMLRRIPPGGWDLGGRRDRPPRSHPETSQRPPICTGILIIMQANIDFNIFFSFDPVPIWAFPWGPV